MSDLPGWLAQYAATLAPAADPLRADKMAAYMRGHFVYLGIATPQRRLLTRPLEKTAKATLAEADILALVQLLWQQPEREYQYAACDLLERAEQTLTPAALPVLLTLVTQKSWWDTVDTLASHSIGRLVARHRQLVPQLDALVEHEHLWLRRTAIIYQLGWKTGTDVPRLFDACLRNAAHPDFFIRKGIGWALREYAWTAPDVIRAFLAEHGQRFSALSVREAGKHLGN
ncbi:DNA alkylation repair protein [Silvimonas iriomotensis]|uniref:DNA alkylation repair protein n=1 Tax=Silvimonas iriomotensis TaxID=449662 RepID=A0ABQ2PE10_9NEIS|nr:DNA alkylation repair protein [Silvimonas iriomotensis]GGP23750.1 DNA alkylation repair protein [Silvimonas iriomotensis]